LEGNDPDKVERIVNLILPSDSVQYARQRARDLADRARTAVVGLPDSPSRRLLEQMAHFVISRPI
jgi:geranylgeranyl pyrophosphate synthase